MSPLATHPVDARLTRCAAPACAITLAAVLRLLSPARASWRLTADPPAHRRPTARAREVRGYLGTDQLPGIDPGASWRVAQMARNLPDALDPRLRADLACAGVEYQRRAFDVCRPIEPSALGARRGKGKPSFPFLNPNPQTGQTGKNSCRRPAKVVDAGHRAPATPQEDA
jgi:hypothetical protein